MTWFKVDDTFNSHPKVLGCPLPALGLWVLAGSWSSAHLTGGYVPATALRLFGAKARDAHALVNVGLWFTADDGWRFHDWDSYQPSAAEVRAGRAATHEKKAAAGRAGGIASGVARRKHAGQSASVLLEAGAKQNEAPSRPVPTRPVVVVPGEEEVEVTLGVEPQAVEAVVRQLAERRSAS